MDAVLDQPVSAIMTTDVASVHPQQRLSAVRHGMLASGGHHVPVIDGERFVGLLTPSDLLRAAPSNAYALDPDALDRALDRVSLRATMQEDVVTITPDTRVRDAAQRLVRGDFHCLPVVAEDGRLAGILTTSDLIRALAKQDARVGAPTP